MLFSNLFVPFVAVLGAASAVIASPVAHPAGTALKARQDQAAPDSLLGILQTLQSGLSSAVANLNTDSGATTSLDTVEGLFTTATTGLQGLGPDSAADVAPADLVSSLLGIVTSVLSLVLSPLSGGSTSTGGTDILTSLLNTVLGLVTSLVPGLLSGLLGGVLGGL